MVVANAVLPPLIAARLPFTLVAGFLLVLVADAAILLAADSLTDGAISSTRSALLVALVAAAVSIVLQVMVGATDDDTYTLRVIHPLAKRSGERGDHHRRVVFLEIDGLAPPRPPPAMRDGNAPHGALGGRGARDLAEWEPDLSSQTGASQAGILLGSANGHLRLPVGREGDRDADLLGPARLRRDRTPPFDGIGLLADGGASRGNLLSGEADHLIVSKLEAEKSANPGYRGLSRRQRHARARPLLLGGDPRDHRLGAAAPARRATARTRGGLYPFMRAAMCVVVRDLIVYKSSRT